MKKKRVPVDSEVKVLATDAITEDVPVVEEVPVAEELPVVEEVTVAEEVSVVEETPVEEVSVEETVVCEEKVARFNIYTIFAIAITIFSALVACLLPAKAITATSTYVDTTLLNVVLGVLGVGKVAFAPGGVAGLAYAVAVMLIPVALVASVALTVISIISPKSAKLYARIIALANFWAFFLVTFLVMCISKYTTGSRQTDIASLIAGAVTGLCYIALTFIARKKQAIIPTVLCTLTTVASFAYLYGIVFVNRKATAHIIARSFLHSAMYVGLVGAVGALFLYSLIRMICDKKKILDVISYSLSTVLAIGVTAFSLFVITGMKGLFIFSIIAFVCSIAQVVISLIALKAEKKAAVVEELEVVEETEEASEEVETVAEEVTEEVETVAEEVAEEEVIEEVEDVDGVVAEEVEDAEEEVLEAETVTPNLPVDELPVVEPIAASDNNSYAMPRFASSYMRARAAAAPTAAPVAPAAPASPYDWFIESLNPDEKAEFVELFIYKFLGGTAVLPDYVPGGDNYEFFRMFFVNLGKYRNRISDGLIEKMYQYMIKRY